MSVLRIAGCTTHAGALDAGDAGALVCELESDEFEYDAQGLARNDLQRL